MEEALQALQTAARTSALKTGRGSGVEASSCKDGDAPVAANTPSELQHVKHASPTCSARALGVQEEGVDEVLGAGLSGGSGESAVSEVCGGLANSKVRFELVTKGAGAEGMVVTPTRRRKRASTALGAGEAAGAQDQMYASALGML